MLYQINKGTKYFGANLIFKDIQFEVKNTEKIAVVGRNGSGKTTLLKVITQNEELDQGQMHKISDIEIGYLAQTTFADNERSVLDEIMTVYAHVIKIKQEIEEISILMKTDHSEKILNRFARLQNQFEQ